MRYPGKARAGEPAKYIPFTSLSGPRVAARGDALGHTAPRCGIQKKIRQECPPNPFLLRPTLDPASQRGVTLSVIPHPDAVSRKCSGRSACKIHSLLRPSLDPASQRGVTPSVIPHPDAVSRKCSSGRARKIHSLLRPSLDPASQRGVTPSVIPHPDAVSRKSSGRRARKIHSFYVPLWPASQRGVTPSVIPHPDAVSRKSSGRRARRIHSLLRSSLDPASQRGVTRSHTAPRCGIHSVCSAMG